MTSEELQFYLKSYNQYCLDNGNQFECPLCKRIAKSRMSYAQHLKKEHYNKENGIKNSGGYNGHYTDSKWLDKMREAAEISNGRRFGYKNEYIVTCFVCHKEFAIKMTDKSFLKHQKFFCSRSCANKRILTEEQKKHLSQKAKENYEKFKNEPEYVDLYQKFCERISNNKYFTSKNELLIREYIRSHHIEDQWTFGSGLWIDNNLISRDLYSKKLHINFEYDGIWHFKDIRGQLFKKQQKDKQLEEWTINNGWKLLRISETWFKSVQNDPSKVESILYMPVWPKNIIKLGDEYQN